MLNTIRDKQYRIWRKKLLTPQYGWTSIQPLSPNTLKLEHHDPGGLLFWEDLVEVAINVGIWIATVSIATFVDPLFALLWSVLSVCFLPFAGRIRFFQRRPPTVNTELIPATIPDDLINRYEQARAEFRAVCDELEDIAARQNPELQWTKP